MVQADEHRDQVGSELPPQREPAGSGLGRRPGCATVYALLLGLAASLLGAAIIFSVAVAILTRQTAGMPLGGLGVLLAVAVVQFLIAWGVWRLRNWARMAVIVVQSLGILLALLGLVATLQGADAALFLGGTLIGVGISGFIIYWFASHGHYFG